MIVTEISRDDMLDGQPLPESPARAAWRAAVTEIAAKAQAVLPAEVHSHIAQAVQMVLNGDVNLFPDGQAKVASQRDSATESLVVNGTCPCPDFARAPSGWCVHRLSAAIAKRAHPLAKTKLEAATHAHAEPSIPRDGASDTPSPIHSIPARFLVEIQGKQFVTFHGLLAIAPAQGLVSLKVDFITVTADLALAHAVAIFQDGRVFEESGDATPANVAPRIKPHFARMALTRAKARALRDALNLAMVCAEELESPPREG